jgi:hypothetical protein
MNDIIVSDIRGLNDRLARVERALALAGLFKALDEHDAELQAEHDKQIADMAVEDTVEAPSDTEQRA